MDKKILNMFTEGIDTEFKKIKRRSTKAVCGVFERQVSVKKENVEKTKRILESKGFIILGTGPAGPGRRFVWYNPAGVSL